MTDGVTLKGRERELASLQRVLDPNGPRVVFVYGVTGVGATPGLVNISVRRFGVLDGPTRVTRGLAEPAGV